MQESIKMQDSATAQTSKTRTANDEINLRSTIEVVVRDRFGKLKSWSIQHNLKVNAGNDFMNTQLFSTAPGTNGANFIALTTDTVAPAAADTTLATEETLNGLARAQGTITHTAGAGSSAVAKTFTYTGSAAKTIAKVGLFTASTAGTMMLETLLASTATVSANGDTLTITWTITY